jgi:enoyl-CoA hydratase/carnithine racemase
MDLVLIERDGAVLRIGLNRPEKKNAITVAMYRALGDALESASGDAGVRVVLIQGQPGIFSSGNDVADFLAEGPRGEDFAPFRFLRILGRFDKPLVAAVSGAAIGVGTTMLLHCDLVYAASDARFQLPFASLGLAPEAASSLLLPRLAGWQKAAELLMLGEPFTAETALGIGLVNQVVAPEKLLETATAAARTLAAKPPASLRATKALMKQALGADVVDDAMTREIREFTERLRSPEAKEAFAAFLEKRKPDFSRFT